jgi:uncharacterized protein YdeI (YjbR/CyaY-like superfamily)
MFGETAISLEPHWLEVPPGLAEALDADGEARRSFERLTYGEQRRCVLPIERARTDAERQRCVTKALAGLRSEPFRGPA